MWIWIGLCRHYNSFCGRRVEQTAEIRVTGLAKLRVKIAETPVLGDIFLIIIWTPLWTCLKLIIFNKAIWCFHDVETVRTKEAFTYQCRINQRIGKQNHHHDDDYTAFEPKCGKWQAVVFAAVKHFWVMIQLFLPFKKKERETQRHRFYTAVKWV